MPLSFLDRLAEPQTARSEGGTHSLEYKRRLTESVCRDLTALLNTRRVDDFDGRFVESTKSLLTFGVIDFTPFTLTSEMDQERVRASVERSIRQFEPRLTRLTVTLDQTDASNLVLHLRIEAFLRNESKREPVSFGMALHRDSRRIIVSGAEE
jgi:type VI secretion system protein ImpF